MISNNDRETQCDQSSQRPLRVENLEDRNLFAADIAQSVEPQSNAIAQLPATSAEMSVAAEVEHGPASGEVSLGTQSLVTDPPIDMKNDVLTEPRASEITSAYYVAGPHNDPTLPVTEEVLIRGYAEAGTNSPGAESLVTDPPIDMKNDVLTGPRASEITSAYYVAGPHNDPTLPVTDEVLIRGYAEASTNSSGAESLVTDPPIDMKNDVLTGPRASEITSAYYVAGPHNDPALPVTDEVLIRGYAISSPTDSSSVGSSVVVVRGGEPALTEQSDPRTAVATDVVLSQTL